MAFNLIIIIIILHLSISHFSANVSSRYLLTWIIKQLHADCQGQSGETNGNESKYEVSFPALCSSRALGNEGHIASSI